MTPFAAGRRRLGFVAIAGAAALAPLLADAAPPLTAAAPVVQSVIACKAVADPTERLACFDKAVAAMDEASGKGDLVTIDHEQRKTIRRQAFGLTLPSLSLFDKGEKPETVNRESFKIEQAWIDAEGKWAFRLETGAVWRQTDTNALMRAPHAGSTADISKGVLGSFFMKVDGQLALRVRRDS
jgi:hypothetical protein